MRQGGQFLVLTTGISLTTNLFPIIPVSKDENTKLLSQQKQIVINISSPSDSSYKKA
jgi:hypothetical protein